MVRLPSRGGLGIIVTGLDEYPGFVVTAAHCIDWSAEGGMALGDYYTERIRTATGQNLIVQVRAVEPVADVAVLGALEDQGSPDAEAFEAFCATIKPVPLAIRQYETDERFRAYV